jgi:alanine racemase
VSFGARARIRLRAIRDNLQAIKEKTGAARVMAVVKANGYGHGLVPVANALANADCLAVARLSEAQRLRESGVDKAIAVLGGAMSPSDIDRAAALQVELVVHDEAQIRWLVESKEPITGAWLKVNTGMNRLGLHPDAVGQAIEILKPKVGDLKMMTHFSSADDPADPETNVQLSRFLPLIAGFEGDISVANSPGLLAWAEAFEQLAPVREGGRLWVRPGLSLYGVSPFPGGRGEALGLRPAMQFEATLVSVRPLAARERVGYGGTWQSDRDTVIGVIAAGYGDGYTRYLPSGTPVLVNGRRVPVVGRVSMDLTTVDLGPEAPDSVGDPVVLWGDGLPVEEIAEYAGTIPYQLLTGVSHREAAIYEDR